MKRIFLLNLILLSTSILASTNAYKLKALSLYSGTYGDVCSRVTGDDIGLPGSGEAITIGSNEISGGEISFNPISLDSSPMTLYASHLDSMTSFGIDAYDLKKLDRHYVFGIGLSVDGETTSTTITDEALKPSTSNICTGSNKSNSAQKNLWNEFQVFFPKKEMISKCVDASTGKLEDLKIIISEKEITIGAFTINPPSTDSETIIISDRDTDELVYTAMMDTTVLTIGLKKDGSIRIIGLVKNYNEQISCLFK